MPFFSNTFTVDGNPFNGNTASDPEFYFILFGVWGILRFYFCNNQLFLLFIQKKEKNATMQY
jgi:hypothetical protein